MDETKKLRRFLSRLWSGPVLRSGVILAAALSLVLGNLVPAAADGPLIPSYTIRDGQPVPAPPAYVQESFIGGEAQACGPFVIPQDLFLDKATGNILVADTGNNRIVILDGKGQFLYEIGGESAGLNAPQGVFVDQVGDIWVADTENQRIAVFAPDGTFKTQYQRPESDFLEGYEFKPSKVVVDKRGFIYTVIGSSANMGLIVMDTTERFRGFFGRTRVAFDLTRLLVRVFASEAQRRRVTRIKPAPLGNIYIDEEGFIYAVSPVLEKDQIQRLNSIGENVYGPVGVRTGTAKLWDRIIGNEGITFGEAQTEWRWDNTRERSVPLVISSVFADVAVDEELGIVSALDQQRARVYQYDQAGNLLSVFGDRGQREGAFSQPTSIIAGDEGRLYVLDADRGEILIFRPTEIMRLIHQASDKYFDGKYEEAALLWAEISHRNTNFTLAHSGLGKALMRQERYQEAMQEYLYAEDKYGYSSAFKEYRYLWTRANFTWLGFGLLVLLVGTAVAVNRLADSFRQLLNAVRRLRDRIGLWLVLIMLVLAVAARMAGLAVQSFHYQEQRPEETWLLFEVGKIVIPWITWCIAMFAVSEIFYGESTFRQVLKGSAWALWPFVVLTLPLNLITQVITLDEKTLYNIGQYLIWALMAWQFFRLTQTANNFETQKTIGVVLLSLLGMLIIWVLLGLIYALTSEIVRFVEQLVLEIYVRQY